eukprot:CAMPEP_0181170446 /NCGR_PEP_ID=MMETSP1096-20121128/1371_1 /TAXON_ID=156174 ORGANISM="Chrysochromulina ericina, Strain CCMP281" /NCGR_SAMPLE_ID=MMETSP1096 /ASSEMBLY_ACC=CAM_ASM_000453 /LENGTH=167 /DNA_ID=CAMNT_0023258009 /DNA_START=363 /DNA_END=867 /DNA_ORIENTATION=-
MHADMYGTCTVCVCGHVCASISSQWLRWHAELPCLASLSGRLLVVRSADPVKGQTATEDEEALGSSAPFGQLASSSPSTASLSPICSGCTSAASAGTAVAESSPRETSTGWHRARGIVPRGCVRLAQQLGNATAGSAGSAAAARPGSSTSGLSMTPFGPPHGFMGSR